MAQEIKGAKAMEIAHRGGSITAEDYRGIPVHAAPGVHAAAVERLRGKLAAGARVADLGAGQGALSQRLHDAGYAVTAIDVSDHDWRAVDVKCHVCDLDGDWSDVRALGPFDAILAVEVIEHLENPRGFLRKIAGVAKGETVFIVSTPNPLDTFSSISLFTRGTFNWFSPQHYGGGGHISILPYWLIDKHLEYLGQHPCSWSFHSAFRHPSLFGGAAYRCISVLRQVVSKSAQSSHFNGETVLGLTKIKPNTRVSE